MKEAFTTDNYAVGHAKTLDALRTRLNKKILGKSEVIELALTTLLARGNLLLEDVPGVGKTTLARHLAAHTVYE